uniref:Gamma-butyrobetaine hydroxylase-like N-terminal domain-containing protein n=1 Tax=Stegastes partitus TaxID=144197 RepID=A0A3B4Z8X6_9TELE
YGCIVRALDQERMMEVEWEDGGHSLYPFTWLRDNCQCPRCTLQSAQARLLPLTDLDVHTGIMDDFYLSQVSIVWPDQHVSLFDAEWLKKRCFSAAARQAMQEELFLNGESEFGFYVNISKSVFFSALRPEGLLFLWALHRRDTRFLSVEEKLNFTSAPEGGISYFLTGLHSVIQRMSQSSRLSGAFYCDELKKQKVPIKSPELF